MILSPLGLHFVVNRADFTMHLGYISIRLYIYTYRRYMPVKRNQHYKKLNRCKL